MNCLCIQRAISTALGGLGLLAWLAATPCWSASLPLTDIQIFFDRAADPGGDTARDRGDTANAFDGDLSTRSFLTTGGTITPHRIGMDLGTSTTINRLRVSKQGDTDDAGAGSGGPGIAPIDNMDLVILYTTDVGPLASRNYVPVNNLISGFGGSESINAAAVNTDGTIDNDSHDFGTDGWYSLSFDSVAATGLAVQFTRDDADSTDFTHYLTNEFELYDGTTPLSILGNQVFSAPIPAGVELNNRGDQGNAIDGDLGSWSFLTPGGTNSPHTLSVDLGGSQLIDRLRVAKFGDTDDGGSGSGAPGIEPIDNMDLEILVSTDSGPLHERSYQPVTGLTNGFRGTELINADAVNSDGTVDNDHHDFGTDGWYSLTFDPVDATSLAIRFARDSGDTQLYTHYRAYEIEVHAVPEPSTCLLLTVSAVGLLIRKNPLTNRRVAG